MKKLKLDGSKMLSKDQMKKITGGYNNYGWTIDCTHVTGSYYEGGCGCGYELESCYGQDQYLDFYRAMGCSVYVGGGYCA